MTTQSVSSPRQQAVSSRTLAAAADHRSGTASDLVPTLVVLTAANYRDLEKEALSVFVLMQSEIDGTLAMNGIHFVDLGKVERQDPLTPYGPLAAQLLQRESSFLDCPDLIVNTKYDPQTEEICSFENQVSHHGSLGGGQSHAFIMYPTVLPLMGNP